MNITFWIIGITVAVSWYSFDKPALLMRLLLNPYRVAKNQEYYRLITSGLVHANFSHLLWNMFSFYFFGSVVEQYFTYFFGRNGNFYFIALYLMAIVVSDLPSYFKNRGNPRYNSLGASGGVAAVIFASILLQPLQLICIYFVFCLPGFVLGTAYLIWSYYSGKKANDHINHEAHLYGALFGLLFCAILYPQSIPLFIDQLKDFQFSF